MWGKYNLLSRRILQRLYCKTVLALCGALKTHTRQMPKNNNLDPNFVDAHTYTDFRMKGKLLGLQTNSKNKCSQLPDSSVFNCQTAPLSTARQHCFQLPHSTVFNCHTALFSTARQHCYQLPDSTVFNCHTALFSTARRHCFQMP
jgi:hypothetical protein